MSVVIIVELLEGAKARVVVVYELREGRIARRITRDLNRPTSWLVPHAMTLLASVMFGLPVVPSVPLSLRDGCQPNNRE